MSFPSSEGCAAHACYLARNPFYRASPNPSCTQNSVRPRLPEVPILTTPPVSCAPFNNLMVPYKLCLLAKIISLISDPAFRPVNVRVL